MSTLVGIGARMATTRNQQNVSQVRAAAMLEIADKTYKNYEHEKRDLPLSIAVKFCDRFDVSLEWLVFGQTARSHDRTVTLVKETIEAIYSEALGRKSNLSPGKAAQIGGFIYSNCVQKDTKPTQEAGPVFDLIDGA
jgi:DNA-binding XRE family transcriptional regulator